MSAAYDTKHILFFSRGRGYGHAIPDMEIFRELESDNVRKAVKFVSYGTGKTALEAAGHEVIDLHLPEKNSYVDTLLRSNEVIAEYQPALIIAHEEFAAITAATLHKLRSIYVGAWLPPAGTVAAESLRHAHALVVLSEPGLFATPAGVTAPVHFVGPIYRRVKFTIRDRLVIRRQLGINPEDTVVLVIHGGWASEQRAPIVDTIVRTFQLIPSSSKRLFWQAGKDADALKASISHLSNIDVFPFYDPIERLIACSDIVITKGTRGITLDAASVGVPSISLSPGTNPIDDFLVPRVPTNTALVLAAVTPKILLDYIMAVKIGGSSHQRQLPGSTNSASKAAKIITSLWHEARLL